MEQNTHTSNAASVATPAVTLRPIGDLLNSAFTEYTAHLNTAFFIVLPPAACFAIVTALSLMYRTADVQSALLEGIVTLIGATLAVFAAIGIMEEIKFGWTLSAPAAYEAARPYFWPVVWVSLLTMLIIVGGSLLFIIPGIIFCILLSFSRFAVIMDDMRGFDSLSFSHALVRNVWFPVLWRTLAMAIIIGIVSFIASKIPYVNIVVPFFSIPFSIIYMVSVYNDLKAKQAVTKEAVIGKNRSLYMSFVVIGALGIPIILTIIGYILLNFAMMNVGPVPGQILPM